MIQAGKPHGLAVPWLALRAVGGGNVHLCNPTSPKLVRRESALNTPTMLTVMTQDPPSEKKGNLLGIATCWLQVEEFCKIVTGRGTKDKRSGWSCIPLKRERAKISLWCDDSCMWMWQPSLWFALLYITSDEHVSHVYQQACLSVYMYLSLSDLYVHVCAYMSAHVLIFTSLFVFIFASLTVTSGPQLECKLLQPVLNLYPTLVTNTRLVVPHAFRDPSGLTSVLCVQLSAS